MKWGISRQERYKSEDIKVRQKRLKTYPHKYFAWLPMQTNCGQRFWLENIIRRQSIYDDGRIMRGWDYFCACNCEDCKITLTNFKKDDDKWKEEDEKFLGLR